MRFWGKNELSSALKDKQGSIPEEPSDRGRVEHY